MLILAADLSERSTGWALGEAGRKPMFVDVAKFRRADERTEQAIEGCALWLRDMLEKHAIDLVCVVQPLSPAVFGGNDGDKQSMAFIIEGQIGLHAVARGICACYGVEFRSPYESSVRKHFCGQSSAAPRRARGHKRTPKEQRQDREATKLMVLRQCWLVGYMKRDDFDDNKADACAVWDFASAMYGRKVASFSLR